MQKQLASNKEGKWLTEPKEPIYRKPDVPLAILMT